MTKPKPIPKEDKEMHDRFQKWFDICDPEMKTIVINLLIAGCDQKSFLIICESIWKMCPVERKKNHD